MSYQIVTAKHGGKLHFRSLSPEALSQDLAGDLGAATTKIQSGTEFEILLPLV